MYVDEWEYQIKADTTLINSYKDKVELLIASGISSAYYALLPEIIARISFELKLCRAEQMQIIKTGVNFIFILQFVDDYPSWFCILLVTGLFQKFLVQLGYDENKAKLAASPVSFFMNTQGRVTSTGVASLLIRLAVEQSCDHLAEHFNPVND